MTDIVERLELCASDDVDETARDGTLEPGDVRKWSTLMREAAAEITRLRAAQQWRPIETAPKDQMVLLWCAEDKPNVVAGHFCEYEGETWWQFSDEALADIQPEGMEPTHWMPLPSPPTKKGTE